LLAVAVFVPVVAVKTAGTQRLLVESVHLKQDSVSLTLTATGILRPSVAADVGSRITGTLVELRVLEGDTVRRGDVLGRIAPEGGVALREAARGADLEAAARLASAASELQHKQQQLSRLRAIADGSTGRGLVAPQDLETAEANVHVAEAALASARASRVAAGAVGREATEAERRTVLVAPFDGVITQVYRRPGETVVPATYGGESGRILTLAQPSTGRITIPVAERYALQLGADDRVDARLLAQPDRTFRSHVRRVGAKPARDGGVGAGFEAELELEPNQGSVPWGATVLVRITVAALRADRVVPIRALVMDPDDPLNTGLFILDGDRMRYRRVEVAQYGDSTVALSTSLPQGAAIAIPPEDGVTVLRDGMRAGAR
jgi:HlyD family secretion protein